MATEEEYVHEDRFGPLTAEAKRELIERMYGAFNAFDLAGVLSVLHQDCCYRVVVGGKVVLSEEGREAIENVLFEEDKRSSSRKKTVMELFARGDRLILEMSYSRVLAISENGMQVGDVKTMDGVAEVTFRDQRIVEYIEIYAG